MRLLIQALKMRLLHWGLQTVSDRELIPSGGAQSKVETLEITWMPLRHHLERGVSGMSSCGEIHCRDDISRVTWDQLGVPPGVAGGGSWGEGGLGISV